MGSRKPAMQGDAAVKPTKEPRAFSHWAKQSSTAGLNGATGKASSHETELGAAASDAEIQQGKLVIYILYMLLICLCITVDCWKSLQTINNINISETDCYPSGRHAPYGRRHVVPSAASLASMWA